MSTTDDTLAQASADLARLLGVQDQVITGNLDLLGGTIDDPDSFNFEGGKTGALGYYPVQNASGQTVYFPCLQRLITIAAGSADPAALDDLLSGRVTVATDMADIATEAAGVSGERAAAAQAALAFFRRVQGNAASEDPIVKLTTALGFVFANFYAEGFSIGGARFGVAGLAEGKAGWLNALGFSSFRIDDDGRIRLPGAIWDGTEDGGFTLTSYAGTQLLSGDKETVALGDGESMALVGSTARKTDTALLRIVNPLGFVSLITRLDGETVIGPVDEAASPEPEPEPEPAIDVKPMIGEELFLVSDRPLPFYGSNLLPARSDETHAIFTVDSRKGLPVQPFVATRDRGEIMLDPARMGTTATVTMREFGERAVRYTKALTVRVRSVPVTGSPAPIILSFGDSISNRWTLHFTKQLLQLWGFAPQFVGTMPSQDGANADVGPLGEAREGWAYSDFLGFKQDSDWTSIVQAGGEAAYMALSKANKRFAHPFLNPNINSGSQCPIVTIGGVQHRFDLRFYLDRFALPNPTIVPINIGMNDRLEEAVPTSIAQVVANAPIFAAEVRRVLPTAKILLWGTNIPVDASADADWHDEWRHILAADIETVRAARAAGDANIHLCSAWAHQTGETGWPLTGSADAQGVSTMTSSDITHPSALTREQHIEALAAAIANLI